MARTPFRPGKFIRNWSFSDAELPVEPDQETLEEIRRRWRRRSTNSSGSSPRIGSSPHTGNSPHNGSAVSVADGLSGNQAVQTSVA